MFRPPFSRGTVILSVSYPTPRQSALGQNFPQGLKPLPQEKKWIDTTAKPMESLFQSLLLQGDFRTALSADCGLQHPEVIVMQAALAFLRANPIQYLATIGLDGKPKNRPFMFAVERDGKLWFCTNNQKQVYKELQKCPYLEIVASSPDHAWIRVQGKAVFEDNRPVKEAVLAANPLIKNKYLTPDHPEMVVFYLEEVTAVISDFSGRPAREYTF